MFYNICYETSVMCQEKNEFFGIQRNAKARLWLSKSSFGAPGRQAKTSFATPVNNAVKIEFLVSVSWWDWKPGSIGNKGFLSQWFSCKLRRLRSSYLLTIICKRRPKIRGFPGIVEVAADKAAFHCGHGVGIAQLLLLGQVI